MLRERLCILLSMGLAVDCDVGVLRLEISANTSLKK